MGAARVEPAGGTEQGAAGVATAGHSKVMLEMVKDARSRGIRGAGPVQVVTVQEVRKVTMGVVGAKGVTVPCLKAGRAKATTEAARKAVVAVRAATVGDMEGEEKATMGVEAAKEATVLGLWEGVMGTKATTLVGTRAAEAVKVVTVENTEGEGAAVATVGWTKVDLGVEGSTQGLEEVWTRVAATAGVTWDTWEQGAGVGEAGKEAAEGARGEGEEAGVGEAEEKVAEVEVMAGEAGGRVALGVDAKVVVNAKSHTCRFEIKLRKDANLIVILLLKTSHLLPICDSL